MMKVCIWCHEEKPLDDFHNDYRKSEVRKSEVRKRPVCKKCSNDRYRPQRVKYTREWRLAHFGLTVEAYEEMLESQGGVCALCKMPEDRVNLKNGELQRLAVDHDHACCPSVKTCGKCIRGLLCYQCNMLLGKIERRGVSHAIVDYLGK